MRRSAVIGIVLALAVPASASALKLAPGDGTLSVSRADGYVALKVRGAVIGRTTGYIEIVDPKDGDCSNETVWGVRWTRKYETKAGLTVCRYQSFAGTASLRFRLVGGMQWVRVYGPDLSISAVGRGDVWLESAKDSNRGSYSFDGDDPSPLPSKLALFTLGTTPTSAGSG
jgi:hypothetical protein